MPSKKNQPLKKSTLPTTESEFKSAERYWKSKMNPPDLTFALNSRDIIWSSEGNEGEGSEGRREARIGWWLNKASGLKLECREIELRKNLLGKGMGLKSWKGKGKGKESISSLSSSSANEFCIIIPSLPGLVLLPSILSPSTQRSLTRESLHCALLPNLTSLSAHYNLPSKGLWNTYTAGMGEMELERIDLNEEGEEARKDREGPRRKVDFEPVTRENWETVSGRGIVVEKGEKGGKELVEAAVQEKKEVGDVEGSQGVGGVEVKATVKDLLKRLRWTTIGWSYDWTSKTYDFSRGKTPLPPLIFSLCRDAVRSVPFNQVFSEESSSEEEKLKYEKWIDYEPQAGVVNYYQLKDSLTAHIDQSEVDAVLPLISFSVGHSAIFLIGGQTRETPPLPILLESGDGLIMSGKGRRLFHGLPRVIPDSLPDYLKSDFEEEGEEREGEDGEEPWKLFGEYLEGGARLNINVRTVF